MKKYISILAFAFVWATGISSAQVNRPAKGDRAARREEKREIKSNSKLQNTDRKKDRKMQKEEDKQEHRDDRHK